jgi:hypothetical protein
MTESVTHNLLPQEKEEGVRGGENFDRPSYVVLSI